MLTPGLRFQQYQLVEKLGEGGQGEVWRAEEVTLGVSYAIKVLVHAPGSARERFLEEGRIQARLLHPGIVRVHSVLYLGELPALLMDFVEGPDLGRWLGGRRLPLEEAWTLFSAVLAAVEAAHRRGVVHRDLKPANVLLVPTPDGLEPKVADFGLAKVLGGPGQTRTGTGMGTLCYAAPEQLMNASDVDARADVYSLGCILYELLAGRPPLPYDPSIIRVYQAAEAHLWPPLRELRPELPGCIDALVEESLAFRREDRPADVATMRRRLEEGLGLPTKRTVGLGGWVPRVHEDSPGTWPVMSRSSASVVSATAPGVLSQERVPSSETFSEDTMVPGSFLPASPGVRPVRPPVVPDSPVPAANAAPAQKRWGLVALSLVSSLGLSAALALNFGQGGEEPVPDTQKSTLGEGVALSEPAPAAAVETAGPAAVPAAAPAVPPTAAPTAVPPPSPPKKSPPANDPATPAPAVEAPVVLEPPTPPVAPAAPTSARFEVVRNGACRVTLSGGGATYAPGEPVPPGNYQIDVDVGSGPVRCGDLALTDGASPTIVCDTLGRCTVRR